MVKEQIQGVGGREGCVQQVQYLLEISGFGPPLENNIIPWTPPPSTFESVHGLWGCCFLKKSSKNSCELVGIKVNCYYIFQVCCTYITLIFLFCSDQQWNLHTKKNYYSRKYDETTIPVLIWNYRFSIDNKSILEIYILCILQSYHLNGDF